MLGHQQRLQRSHLEARGWTDTNARKTWSENKRTEESVMSLPSISGVARLLEDPELRFGPSGVAICKMRLVFNSRKLNQQTQQWEDSDSFFVDGVVFKEAAEQAAESYTRQSEVVVSGRLKTRQWEDREGKKRSTPELVIDAIGASTRFATVKIQKMQRSSGGGQSQPAQGGNFDDPWSTSAGNGPGRGPAVNQDEPPF
jgi:single-strand DNA-binding protein